MRVTWCDQEPRCGGGFCAGVAKHAGRLTMAIVKPVEDGRRPDDVVRIFTIELARARVKDGQGADRLVPLSASYVIHTVQSEDGQWHWVAMYADDQPLDGLMPTMRHWDEAAANQQVTAALLQLDSSIRDRPPQRRRW